MMVKNLVWELFKEKIQRQEDKEGGKKFLGLDKETNIQNERKNQRKKYTEIKETKRSMSP